MAHLYDILAEVEPRHRVSLEWFQRQRGTEQPWFAPLSFEGEDLYLATRAKGIYKPGWSKYAVSVRQGINSIYKDIPPLTLSDGTWLYMYFQEDEDPANRDRHYTNLALLQCEADQIPVGVIQQVKAKPNPRYFIWGLALVRSWSDGYFFLEGIPPTGEIAPELELDESPAQFRSILDSLFEDEDLDPARITDERIKAIAESVVRPGQQRFRRQLLTAYHGQCAFSGCEVVNVLQAAHITPFRGPVTDSVSNGMLLRADLHILFDDNLLTVDPAKNTVVVAPSFREGSYGWLQDRELHLPHNERIWPNRTAIHAHRERCAF